MNMSIPMSNNIMPHCFNSFLFFFLWFSFVLHEICQTPATEPGNYYNLCMQIISPSKWVEGKNLILKFPVFHPFFTASLNKNSVYYLSSDF